MLTMKHKRPLRILAPAKINLFLQIIGKRADGYHDLASLMCCVGLYDEIIISVGKHDTSVVCEHPEVPEDESNLAHRAAAVFLDKLKTSQGAEIPGPRRRHVRGHRCPSDCDAREPAGV